MKRLAIAVLVFFALTGRAFAQNGVIVNDQVQGPSGMGIAGATVTVCTSAGTGTPCTPTTPIYTSSALTTTLSNPTTTDAHGNFSFWIAPGTYIVTITGTGLQPFTKTITPGCIPGATGCASGGGTLNINGSPVSSPNLNSASPSPDTGFQAATLKVSGSNAIVEVPSLPSTLTAPGVWTNTQMNENFQVIVGSGVNCSPSFIFSTMELGDFATDGVSGTACVPSTATAQLGVGVAGYATSAEPNSCGAAAPPCGGVGIEGNGLSVAAGTTVCGVVGVVQSTTGDAAQLFGSEIDITPLNSGDSGFGELLSLNRIVGAGANPNFTALQISAGVQTGGTAQWTNGILFGRGSILPTASTAPAIILNPSSGNPSPSQAIIFTAASSSGTLFSSQLIGNVDPSGNLVLSTNVAEGLWFSFLRLTPYTATGNPVPTCNANAKNMEVEVSDATAPTFLGNYVSGGAVLSPAICNGTNWVTY